MKTSLGCATPALSARATKVLERSPAKSGAPSPRFPPRPSRCLLQGPPHHYTTLNSQEDLPPSQSQIGVKLQPRIPAGLSSWLLEVMAPPCTICNSAYTQLCKQCHSSSYCSTKCQKIDWPCHKLLCSHFTTNNERPGTSYKRGILFEPDAKAPAFIWIKCDGHREDPDEPEPFFEVPQFEEWIGVGVGCMTPSKFFKNYVRGRESQQPCEMWMRDNFLNDGSSGNQSAIAATKGAMAHDWRGPLIALKYKDAWEGGRNVEYADMDMQDFREAVDYLTYHTNEVTWSKFLTAGGPRPKASRV